MKNKKPKFDKELDGFALEGIKAYLDYHFKGFPAIASLAKLTAWQNDAKKAESDVISAALGKAAVQAASYSNYQAIVALDKNVYFQVTDGLVSAAEGEEGAVEEEVRGEGEPSVFRRRIDEVAIRQALAVIVLSIGTVVTAALVVITLVPISIAGWGIREGAMIFGFALVGVAEADALALSVATGLCQIVAGIPGGLIWLARGRPKVGEAVPPAA